MLSRVATIVVPRLLTLLSAGQVNRTRHEECTNAPEWAAPLSLSGVPNLYRINHDLYRSGQPTIAGFHRLQEFGIKSCMSLRAHCTDRTDARGVDVLCVWRPILGVSVTPDEIEEAMLDLHYRLPKPVLVHCYQGSDRTGLLCAAYRILIENWPVECAIEEMILGGFGFHKVYRPYVTLLQELDVNRIRQRLTQFARVRGARGVRV